MEPLTYEFSVIIIVVDLIYRRNLMQVNITGTIEGGRKTGDVRRHVG